MNRRLQQFLAAENISQAQFADTIEVARASISHVLSGRNKPGYDFIKSISDHYPKLSMEWLVSGKGKMYKDSLAVSETENPQTVKELPSNTQILQTVPEPVPAKEPEVQADEYQDTLFSSDDDFMAPSEHPFREKPEKKAVERKILKVVVFYDDGTYKELK